MASEKDALVVESADQLWQPNSRREFLRLLGVGGSIVLLPSAFTACSGDDDDDLVGPGPGTGGLETVTINLTNDIGIFNLTYALEQIETAFYSAAVTSAAFSSMTADEQEIITDIRNAEFVHREFLRAALGSNAIGQLRINTAGLNTAISSATNILRTSEALEETGVSTLNGAGKYLTSMANLAVSGKIVSVEARHVAAIRDAREARGITNGLPAGTRFAGDDAVVPSGPFAGLDVKIEAATTLQRVQSTNLSGTTITLVPPATRAGTPDFPPPLPTP